MSDLISRQAAIDAILHNQEVYSNNFGNDPIDKYTIAIIDNDAQTVAQLPSAQPEQRWIPCKEMLPEYDGEMYLVTQYCEQINRRRISISYCYVNREGFWSDVHLGYKVIAWMPLPKPWRGEANEGTVHQDGPDPEGQTEILRRSCGHAGEDAQV